jgi:hypothetical protein
VFTETIFIFRSYSFLLHIPDALADPNYLPVRVPHVHLANVPWHVRRWKSHFEHSSHALSGELVNIFHPYRHPDALAAHLVSV